jgi:hypothetical protein
MHWLFTTEIPSVTKRMSHFMGFHTNESSLETQFAPALIFDLWRDGSLAKSTEISQGDADPMRPRAGATGQ